MTRTLLAIAVTVGGCYEGIHGTWDPPAASTGPGGSGVGDPPDADESRPPEAGECAPRTPNSVVRMLNRREYRNTIRDLFGLDEQTANLHATQLPADAVVQFDNNAESLVASALHVETQLDIAEALAATLEPEDLLPCPGCIAEFLDDFGRRAYRRPLTEDETASMVELFDSGRSAGRTEVEAARLVVQALMMSPQFLYRLEPSAEADGRVAGYELASRLSYFVWGSMPDDTLLEAADAGELRDVDVVEDQVRRLLEDPRAHAAVASFHRQWLELPALDQATKDPELVPSFETLKGELTSETLAFLEFVFWDDEGSAKDLLVSDEIVLNDRLAAHYEIDGEFGPGFEVAAATQTRFGLLTQGSILAHTAHAHRTSPTDRGRFVRQQLLCQDPPPPPAAVPDLPDAPPTGSTLRELLRQHVSDPACSSCHLLLDPIGFGMENYDLVGRYRTRDGGAPIDASGELLGVPEVEDPAFEGLRELSELLADSGAVDGCVTQQWFRFAMGRPIAESDACTIEQLRGRGSMRELLVAIATSEAFRHRAGGE